MSSPPLISSGSSPIHLGSSSGSSPIHPIEASSASQGSEVSSMQIKPAQLLHHFAFAIIFKRLLPISPFWKYYNHHKDPTLLDFIHKHYPTSLSLFEELLGASSLSASLAKELENLIGDIDWNPLPALTEYEQMYDVHRLLNKFSTSATEQFIFSFLCENEMAPLDDNTKMIVSIFMNQFLDCTNENSRLLFMYRYANRPADQEIIEFTSLSNATSIESLSASLQVQETKLKIMEITDFSVLLFKKIEKLQEEIQGLNQNLKQIEENIASEFKTEEEAIVIALNRKINQAGGDIQLLLQTVELYQSNISQEKEKLVTRIEQLETRIAIQMSNGDDDTTTSSSEVSNPPASSSYPSSSYPSSSSSSSSSSYPSSSSSTSSSSYPSSSSSSSSSYPSSSSSTSSSSHPSSSYSSTMEEEEFFWALSDL